MLRRMQEDMQGIVVSPVLAEQSLDKRPKLERAHSAAEKENLPLQRSSSVLRRQYSQQEQVSAWARFLISICDLSNDWSDRYRQTRTFEIKESTR